MQDPRRLALQRAALVLDSVTLAVSAAVAFAVHLTASPLG